MIFFINNTTRKLDKHNTDNRLTSVSGTGSASKNYSFGYDSRGNVTANGSKTFNYNLANQMTGSGNNSYVYDGHNRRVRQTDSHGTSYSFYSQSGQLLYRETPKGGMNYIYLGGKLIAKDGVTPQNSAKQHFRPFGSSIEGEKDDVGYTGHKFDKDLGLSYMQARYYDPVIGRFYSNDPIGYRDIHSFNRYAYGNNNPYRYTDPTGMCSLDSTTDGNGKSANFCSSSSTEYSNSVNNAHRQARDALGAIGYRISATPLGGGSGGGQEGGGERTLGSHLPGIEAGESAAQFWADIAVTSDHPLAPLAHVPGVLASLWTGETAANTAVTLGTAGVGSIAAKLGGNALLSPTLGNSKIGHRLFTATRKNGTWNTGKWRFGWSGKNGSDTYGLMVRYKKYHSPPIVNATRPPP